MNVTWAVARQMMAECIRMKIALVFLVLTYLGNTAMSGVERKFRIPGLQMPGQGMDHGR